jgi:hypothetical protein
MERITYQPFRIQGVTQHRRSGYKPMVDAKPVPGTRKGTNAVLTTKAKEDNTAMVG